MPRFSSPLQFLAAFLAIALAILTGLTLLPHDRYIRFQQMASESVHYLRAKWIYERIHFDPTPIDVAFIGTSHTQCSIDAEIVEKRLQKNGLPWHVVNFAIPRLGRDLHYLIVRELLENRQIKTLVVEVQEGESRAPHPAFDLLSDPSDVFTGPYVVNSRFFEIVAGLPLRQTSLFLRTEFPAFFNLQPRFRLATYEGPYWNDTYRVHGFTETRTDTYPSEHFDQAVADLRSVFERKQALARKLTFPFSRYSLPYRYDMIYFEKLLNLAQQHGVKIVFMYMPFFHGPVQPIDAEFLRAYGPIITPADVLADPASWQNAEHLNVYGARRVSGWVATQLASMNDDISDE